MNEQELQAVLDRYPELEAGLPEHLDEVLRIAARILEAEQRPPQPPVPWAGLSDVERADAFDAAYPRRSA